MTNIIVMGGGSWGAAITYSLGQNAAVSVTCLVRDETTASALNKGVVPRLNDAVLPTPILAKTTTNCLADADMIYIVLPAAATMEALVQIEQYAPSDCPVILCAKGLVTSTNETEVSPLFLPEVMNNRPIKRPYAILSGPSFADEVIQNLPAALVCASHDNAVCTAVSHQFSSSNLRIYLSDDPIGVAIGGAIKNIIALASGICDGLGLGDNAKAALITRGLAETGRLINALGGKKETISGLAGIGDLVLSASGPHSRNMAYGLALGQGKALPSSLSEGARSAPLMVDRALALDIEMPITNAVSKALSGEPLSALITDLLARPTVKE